MREALKECERCEISIIECIRKVGINDYEGPPVPIPNTEVKLISVESTWLATAREDRTMPTFLLYIPMCSKTDLKSSD